MGDVARTCQSISIRKKRDDDDQEISLCTYQCQAPGGGGSGYPRGFDCEGCPQGEDFDRTRYPQGGEFHMTTIFDNEEGSEINL